MNSLKFESSFLSFLGSSDWPGCFADGLQVQNKKMGGSGNSGN
jgi:hypothetical protein